MCEKGLYMIKIDGLEELHRWILNTNNRLRGGQLIICCQPEVNNVKSLVERVATSVKNDYPFYASELPQIVNKIFHPTRIGYSFNSAAFGELYIIVKHLHSEPRDSFAWLMMHPRIVSIAKEEYWDGHYASAANRSFVEVETRLRELFAELKPDVTVPAKVGDIIGALLSENGAYNFCDTSTQSGKDYLKGVKLLFKGAISAYRNPSSHENIALEKEEAFEQIVLASQLMKVLDNT